VHTSWVAPDAAFDAALAAWVDDVLDDPAFTADLEAFLVPLEAPARTASLARLLLKLTAPGIPDIYQGTETWGDSLVDPDNRRPVDYESRRALLDEISGLGPEDLLARAGTGAPKMAVIARALGVRRREPAAFGAGYAGRYRPLSAAGMAARNVVAFLRGDRVATIVPRFLLSPSFDGWGDTSLPLPNGTWRDEITRDIYDIAGDVRENGGSILVAEVLARFPVALLVRTDGGDGRPG
jgi:(1->4)-alpha-D-glucan 1-alpha-D-glucosylmutase